MKLILSRIKGVIQMAIDWAGFLINTLIPINEIYFEEIRFLRFNLVMGRGLQSINFPETKYLLIMI